MLGLKLALRIGRDIIDVMGKLLSKVAIRSTYSENLAGSRSLVTEIDKAGVLDDATILLTPTAYSNTRVHSVKTYTGDNVYDDDIDEAVNGGTWTDNGDGTFTVTGAGYPSVGIGVRDISASYLTDGNSYSWTVDGSNVSLAVYDASFSLVASGTSPLYFTATATNRLYISPTDGVSATYSNVSLVDVSSDFDFDRASSATRINSDGLVQDMQSITDVDLVQNGDFEELGSDIITNGTFDTNSDWDLSNATIQDGYLTLNGSSVWARQNILSLNKTYYFELDAVVRSGTARIQAGGGADNFSEGFYIIGSTGFHSGYISSLGVDTFLYLIRNSTCDIDIDNVSVQQVDPNDRWNVTSSDANNYVEFTEGFARLKFLNTSPITMLNSTLVLEANKTYELVVDVHDVTSGAIKIDSGGLSETFNTEGVTTRYLKPTGNTTLSFYRATANVDITLASVSVKDITFSEDVDLARINYDSNGENGHWLLEPTSTNLITYSENFEDSSWSNASVGTAPTLEGGYTAPDGSNSAYKITNANQDSFWYSSSVIGADNSRTIWARTVSGTGTAQLTSHNSNTNNTFNLTETWQRFEVNGTTSGIGSTNFYAVDFRGSGTLTELLIWGAQAEALSYATSYIPTYGSTVTRATETLTGSGNSTLINSTEGVLYAEMELLQDVPSANMYFGISSGALANSIFFRFNTLGDIFAYNAGLGSSNIIASKLASEIDLTNYFKLALKYGTTNSDFSVYVNGVELTQSGSFSATAVSGLSKLDFALYDGTSSPFYGKCKALAVFDRALNDDELELLTGVTNYGSFNELAQANGYTII